MRPILALLLLTRGICAAEPEFPLTADSQPQPNVLKGTMLKDTHTAKEGSVFPGTQREYQIYLPAGFDKTQPSSFMVFQDGVIYQAPVVFDNLIARKDIPPLVGIFIKPGVVPAANDNALPRFNRSHEYDSITPTYSHFLLDEFLPAIEAKHGLKLSTDPNHAAISGNSSGGICAFMAAWHRPDRFRRVFTGVGTYVGIHGADQLPVLVRKFEPKPLRVFLQSGTGDNNLYCGDWWMANQMMERSLAWAGYDVNHAWGEGGHNAKHASQIFPDVMRWLWRDWQKEIEVKANPKSESKWKGYEVVGEGEWTSLALGNDGQEGFATQVEPDISGNIYFGPKELAAFKHGNKSFKRQESIALERNTIGKLSVDGSISDLVFPSTVRSFTPAPQGAMLIDEDGPDRRRWVLVNGTNRRSIMEGAEWKSAREPERNDGYGKPIIRADGELLTVARKELLRTNLASWEKGMTRIQSHGEFDLGTGCFSPDQTLAYLGSAKSNSISVLTFEADGGISPPMIYHMLERPVDGDCEVGGLCVDTNGWLYVATSLGIQVCDQAGRVNFIIPTPKQSYDVCFGGKDLSELFIACGDTIYKCPTKAKGVVSGQQPPIKPAPPKL